MSEEHELVRRCVHKDESAFAELVRRYQAMVFTLADRMVRDPAVTEDLAQEVFIRVFRGLPGFRGTAKLSTWIYQIAYRVCLEELQHPRRRQPHVSLDQLAPEVGHPPAAGVSQGIADAEFREDVDHWLAQLPPPYRMAVTLYYLEDRRYAEIATVMGLPIGTVKTYLHRAKRFLKDRILDEEPVT